MRKKSIMPAAILSREEFDRMLDYQEKNCEFSKAFLRNYSILLLLGDQGLRVGEMVQLEKDDLCIEDNLIRFLQIRPEIAKYNIERRIPLSKRTRGCLVQYFKEICLWDRKENPWLFPSPLASGNHISERQVENITARIGMASLGRSINPHALRHSYATRLMKIAPMPVVQQLLGHKNLASTQVYVHPDSEDLLDAVSKL